MTFIVFIIINLILREWAGERMCIFLECKIEYQNAFLFTLQDVQRI